MTKQEKINDLQKRIERLESYMRCQEIGNDYYHTMGSYREDNALLHQLKSHLKQIEARDD